MEHIIGLLGKIVYRDTEGEAGVPVWHVVASSFFGGFCFYIADIAFNSDNTITSRIANSLGSRLPALDSVWFESLAFVVIVFMGLGLCFVFRPATRPAAFSMGSGVMSVLVTINTGVVHFAGSVSAADIELSNTVPYSYAKPRRYGAFGLGTAITGKSNARLQTKTIDQPVNVDCQNEYRIGEEQYCSVKADLAERKLGIPPQNNSTEIWVQK